MSSQITNIHYKDLCQQMIEGALKRGWSWFTSWQEFEELEMQGIIPENIPQWKKLRAVAFGVQKGWLIAGWQGVGLTPWAGNFQQKANPRQLWLTFTLKSEKHGIDISKNYAR